MNSILLTPIKAGDLFLRNRVVMAPLTRVRAGPAHVPNALMAEYYRQRASAGLIMTECTMVAADACAFLGEAGIFDETTAAGWRQVTDAVHAAGRSDRDANLASRARCPLGDQRRATHLLVEQAHPPSVDAHA